MPIFKIPNPETGRPVNLNGATGKKSLEHYKTNPESRKELKKYLQEKSKSYTLKPVNIQ